MGGIGVLPCCCCAGAASGEDAVSKRRNGRPMIMPDGWRTPTPGLREDEIENFYAAINAIRMRKFAEQRRMMPRYRASSERTSTRRA
jgi:hypothetical protein